MDVLLAAMIPSNAVQITPEILSFIAGVDDLKLALERDIKKLDRRIKESRTKSKAAGAPAEKLAAQKEQREMETLRDRNRRELFIRQDEIQGRRDKLIDTLEGQLQQQLAQHYYEDIGESEVVVSQGFTPLKSSAVTTEGEVLPLHQPPADRSRIATVVYGGFAKCAYTYQKFHSDTERVLAEILERDAQRWFRPVQGQFNIYYRHGVEQPEYLPDFVAATPAANLLIETTKATDVDSDEVQAKAEAAVEWCAHASAYSALHGEIGRAHV